MKRFLPFLLALLSAPSWAGTLYVSTGGATTNSGSRDSVNPHLSGTGNAYLLTTSTNIVYLPAGSDLSGVVTSGSTQDTVYLASATNSNMKIFWITAVDDTADTVTVHASVTQTSMSSMTWTIGGHHVLTNASIESSLRAGDTLIFNDSPASGTGSRWTFRNSGSTAAGPVKIKGKTGTRPTLTTTNTADCVTGSGSITDSWIENLEIIQQGATGGGITALGYNCTILNVKISDSGSSGGIGNNGNSASWKSLFNEVSGSAGSAINMGAGTFFVVYGNYVHDTSSYGIYSGGSGIFGLIARNVIDTCTNQGIRQDGTPSATRANMFVVEGNTIYNCNQDGIYIVDADTNSILFNNIFKDNGDTGSEYNISLGGSTSLFVLGKYNLANISGGRGGANLSNYTADATDLTTDPLFTNGAGGDFSLGASSPAKATGYPGALLGGNTGYMDMGAVQRQETSSGGAKMTLILD